MLNKAHYLLMQCIQSKHLQLGFPIAAQDNQQENKHWDWSCSFNPTSLKTLTLSQGWADTSSRSQADPFPILDAHSVFSRRESGSGRHSEHTTRGRRFTKIEINTLNSAHFQGVGNSYYSIWKDSYSPCSLLDCKTTQWAVEISLSLSLGATVQLEKES